AGGVSAGALDLQHVRAEVGRVAGGAGAGDDGGEVDDPDVGQRPAARPLAGLGGGGRLVGHGSGATSGGPAGTSPAQRPSGRVSMRKQRSPSSPNAYDSDRKS